MITGLTFPYQQSADPILPGAEVSSWLPEDNQPPRGHEFVLARLVAGVTDASLLIAPRDIEVPAGNLTLSTSASIAAATTGSIQFAGTLIEPVDPYLISDLRVTIWGEYSIGVPPSEVPAADLTLSTTVPSVEVSFVPSGNLTLSTTAVSQGVGVSGASGDLVLSTTAPSVDGTTTIQRDPPQGDLVLSTAAPIAGIGVQGTQGDLTLSSEAPALAVTASHNITVPQGDLTLSGQASTFHFGVALTAGDLTLSTSAPTRQAGSNRLPGSGDLTLSTSTPAIGITFVFEISAGNLVLDSGTSTLTQTYSDAQEAEPARTYVTRVRKTISQFQPRRTKKTSRVRLTRWLTTKR
jgi:hypothetical protein